MEIYSFFISQAKEIKIKPRDAHTHTHTYVRINTDDEKNVDFLKNHDTAHALHTLTYLNKIMLEWLWMEQQQQQQQKWKILHTTRQFGYVS